MSDIERFDYYDVDVADIWFCERAYLFSKKKDLVFATKFLETTQLIVSKLSKPALGKEMRISDGSYYEHKYDLYVKNLHSIENQFALDFFFFQDKCFVYNNPIKITKANENFEYWFTLKLRQYDGKILKIANFLDYQLKNNFHENISDFQRFLLLY